MNFILNQIIIKLGLWIYYVLTKISLLTQIFFLYLQIKVVQTDFLFVQLLFLFFNQNGYYIWIVFALPCIIYEKMISAKYLVHCQLLVPNLKSQIKMAFFEQFLVTDIMCFLGKNSLTFDNIMIKCKIQNTLSAIQSLFLFIWIILIGKQEYILFHYLVSLSSFTVLILNSKNIDSEYFFDYYPDLEETIKILIDLSNSISYIVLMIIFSIQISMFFQYFLLFIFVENILLVFTLKRDTSRPFTCHIYLSKLISWALFFIDSWANALSDVRISISRKHSYDYRGFQAFKFWKLVSCMKLLKSLIALLIFYKYFYEQQAIPSIQSAINFFICVQLINFIYQCYWNYVFVLEPIINGDRFIQIKTMQQLDQHNNHSLKDQQRLFKNLLFTEIKVPNNQQHYQNIVFTLLFQFNLSTIYTQFSSERVKIRKQDPKNNYMIVILSQELSIYYLQQYLKQGHKINPYIKQIDFGVYFLNLEKSVELCRFFSKNQIYIQLFSIHNTVFKIQEQYFYLKNQLVINSFIFKNYFQQYMQNNNTQIIYDLID